MNIQKITKTALIVLIIGIGGGLVSQASAASSGFLPATASDLISKIGSLSIGGAMPSVFKQQSSACINRSGNINDSSDTTGNQSCLNVSSDTGTVALASFDKLLVKNAAYLRVLPANLNPILVGAALPAYVNTIVNTDDALVVNTPSNSSMIVTGLRKVINGAFIPTDTTTQRTVCSKNDGTLIAGDCISSGGTTHTGTWSAGSWSNNCPTDIVTGTCFGGEVESYSYSSNDIPFSAYDCGTLSNSRERCLAGFYGMGICRWEDPEIPVRTRNVSCMVNGVAVDDFSYCDAATMPETTEACPEVISVCNMGNMENTFIPASPTDYIIFDNTNSSCGGGTTPLFSGAGGDCYTTSGCFIEGTQVTMADGSLKNIEDVTTGEVLKGSTADNPVMIRYAIDYKGPIYSMNNSDYFVSSSHPFMTTEGWKSFDPKLTRIESPDLEVSQLEKGDILIRQDGSHELLEDFDFKIKETKVYNFGLNGSRDYYADGYLVHNVNLSPIVNVADAAQKQQVVVCPGGGTTPPIVCPAGSTESNGYCCWPGTWWNADSNTNGAGGSDSNDSTGFCDPMPPCHLLANSTFNHETGQCDTTIDIVNATATGGNVKPTTIPAQGGTVIGNIGNTIVNVINTATGTSQTAVPSGGTKG